MLSIPERADEQEFGSPLASNDAQAVDDAIKSYSQLEAEAIAEERAGGEEAEEQPVPTEFLQEDASALLELPPTTSKPSVIARLIAAQPLSIVLMAVGLALLTTLWLTVGGQLHLSVNEELIEARQNILVRHHDSVLHLGDFAANVQFAEAAAMQADDSPLRQQRQLREQQQQQRQQRQQQQRQLRSGPAPTRTCSREDPRQRITLLYESRSGHTLLIPETVEAIHSIEADLKAWLNAEDLCWAAPPTAGAPCECLPFDSIASYLYPQILDPRSATPRLRVDGDGAPRPVCAPSYSVRDLRDALGWLARAGKTAFARPVDAGGDHSSAAAAAPRVEPSRYLRTFAYLSKPKWEAAKQRDPAVTKRLRAALDTAASSLRVRCVAQMGSTVRPRDPSFGRP